MAENQYVSFGGFSSKDDYRTLKADSFATTLVGGTPRSAEVELDYDEVDERSNQRKIGICTACGVRISAEVHFHDGERLCEEWLYIMGKVLIDDPMYGGYHFEGSSALTMLKASNKYGIPRRKMLEKYPLKIDGTYEEFWNHFKTTYKGIIPAGIIADAAAHRIPGYYEVPVTPMGLAKEVANGRLPVIRMVVGDNFYTDKNGKYTRRAKDLFPLRVPKVIESGHIMAMNEYKGLDLAQVVRGPNSWNDNWGDKGFFEFVFGTQAPAYFTEAWAIADSAPAVVTHVKDLPAAKNFTYPFLNRIEYGDETEEVKKLHIALAILGYLNVSLDEWGIYGNKTAAAVLAYQKAKKLLPVAQLEKNKGHYVHELTLAALRKDINK